MDFSDISSTASATSTIWFSHKKEPSVDCYRLYALRISHAPLISICRELNKD